MMSVRATRWGIVFHSSPQYWHSYPGSTKIELVSVSTQHTYGEQDMISQRRHQRLGEGIIGEEGLRILLSDPRIEHVAVLLETPIATDENGKEDWEHDARQITKAKGLL
jgi:endonuclease IV